MFIRCCPMSALVPGNILQGAGRQHDWCLPTTPHVTGISTFAGKGRFNPAVIIYSNALTADFAREMSAGQHRCLFGFGCYRCIMPISAGYHKPPFYFLSTYLTEESKKAPHPCEAFRLTSDLLTQVLCSCTNSNN